MKKLILTPKTDSITICLPPDWVGKTITCILKEEDESIEIVTEVSDRAIEYHTHRYRNKKSRKK
ncbi:MAG: hypothetical protein RR356_00810 [Bacteroidales bacterium]